MRLDSYPLYKQSGISWYKKIPQSWEVLPLYALAHECSSSNKGMIEDNLLSLSYGKVINKDINSNDGLLPESFETYQVVEPDDIVLRLTDLQNDKRSLRSAIVTERGIITSAYLAIRPKKVDARFLNYLLRAYDLTKVFYSMGGGLRQSMKFSDVKRLPLILPSLLEQKSIVTFLDHETSKIDTLVAAQGKLIDLLKEKRQAVISHAVTKGLNSKVRLKDSGVEWLGEVPDHWEVKKIRYLLNEKGGLVRGPFGGDLKKEIFVKDGIKVLEQKNAIYKDTTLGDSFITEEKFDEMKRFEVFPGDYIMSCSGTIGKTYRIPEGSKPAIINQALMIMRFKNKISNKYLDWIFQANFFVNQILDNSQGGAMKNLVGMDIFTAITLPCPPLDEQIAISCMLSKEMTEFDFLIDESTRVMKILKERRSALISAAVNGQIDVRNYQLKQVA
ncbi:restriction endonuclease subunit S [Shewanella sp.]|uniref:restriction endonuclease subunit S n=1 Tax=Shewanella sp. TaxID=50422 RepID=UPI004047293C